MNKKRVAVVWHQQMEEIEGIVPVDLLRRAGIEVNIFSANGGLDIVGSHHIKLKAEKKIEEMDVDRYDAIVLIGGPGVDGLLENNQLANLVLRFHQQSKLVGAICAAPQILGKIGIADGLKLTHYPGSTQFLNYARDLTPKPLVISKNIITSVGPGAAIEYALALINYLSGRAIKNKVKKEIVYQS